MKISRSQSSRYEAPQHADDGEYGVPVVSIGDWMLTTLILMIPLVNLVMILVWIIAIGGTNPSKANFFRAIALRGEAVNPPRRRKIEHQCPSTSCTERRFTYT